MTTIHMNTDTVRVAASQLEQNANAIFEAMAALNSQVKSFGWEGPSSDSYRIRFSVLVRQFEAISEQISTLGLRIQREVNEWEEVDQGGPARLMPNPGVWEDIKRSIRDFGWYILFPYSLQDGFDHLLNQPAGKQLLEELIAAGIMIQITGDGTYGYQGDGAKVVTINWGDSIGGGQYDPSTDTITIPDDVWSRLGHDSDGLAGVLGHEMQHALDDQTNTYVEAASDADLKNYSNLSPEAQNKLSEGLANDLEHYNIDSEVRAYERSDALANHQTYQDDGINTGAERQAILDKQLDTKYTYETYYEKALADNYPGLEFDVWIDSNGEVQVTIMETASAGSTI